MAGAAILQGEAEPLTRAGDVPELSEGAQRSNRTPRRWVALGAALLAAAGAAVVVPRAGRPAAAPMGKKLVKLETLPTKAELHVTYLDFIASTETGGHPDFEPGFRGKYSSGDNAWYKYAQKGLVKPDLGSDNFPVFNDCNCETCEDDGCSLSTKENFAQWWVKSALSKEAHDELQFTEKSGSEGVWECNKPGFFPLSGSGWDDRSPKDRHNKYPDTNFYFTMQARKSFVYHGGEYFEFTGDDDLWVYFNGYLGMDIGGPHMALSEKVELDDIAEDAKLVKGETVFLQIFFAERAYEESNFIVTTNIQLQEDACFEYDRVLLYPDSADSLKWEGYSVHAGDKEGMPVNFEFVCTDGDCDGDQPAGGKAPAKYFPVVSLAAGKSMSLDIKIAGKEDDDGATEEYDQEDLFITFYELQEGMTIEAEGVTEYVLMGDSDVEYTRKGTADVFASSAPTGTDPPEYPDELSEANKKMAVSLKFAKEFLDDAKITLKNAGDEDALFRFTLTPMFECVPCLPACEANQPFREAITTTAPALKAEDTTTTEPYECCFFDKVGVKFGCQGEKPWYIPWCPGEAKMPWDGLVR